MENHHLFWFGKKTELPCDVWNYDYNFRKSQKKKKRVTKQQDMSGLMKVPKNHGWNGTSLQRTEAGISVDPKEFTREMIEMVSRLDLCWQSSCVYYSWIPEELSKRITIEEPLVDSAFREKRAEEMAESARRMFPWEKNLSLGFSKHTATLYRLPFLSSIYWGYIADEQLDIN